MAWNIVLDIEERKWPQGTPERRTFIDCVMVGRDPRNDITSSSANISRRHAKLFVDENGTLFIQDLGTANGLQSINGSWQAHTWREPFAMAPGDFCYFGNVVVTLVEAPSWVASP